MKIVIIESHPVFRLALVSLLGSSGFDVVGEGVNATEALALAARHRPDILLIDHVFPNLSDLAALTKVVVFAGNAAPEPAVIALDTGASGYILKAAAGDELVRGLGAVAGGSTYVSSILTASMFASFRNETTRKVAVEAARLSARELQIVRLLMLGRTNKQIAAGLAVSEKTVKHYMSLLMQKLNARNRLEAVIAAQKLGGSVTGAKP